MTRKRAIRVSIVFAVAALLLVGIVVVPDAFDRALKAGFVGPEHVYQLSEHPHYLTEDLAIAKGRETMARDGFDTNAWTLVPDDRSSAPDGRDDLYFVRNTKNPNQGSFTVRDASGSRRFVHVQLEGNRVTSCVVIPK
jgi:hypothetical protein